MIHPLQVGVLLLDHPPQIWYNQSMRDVILTGIRSNEELTLGNYLGAFLPMVAMQKKYADSHQINMFVPDLHSITTPTDYSSLFGNSIQNLRYYIASGLDVEQPNTYIYRQSYIPAHSELTWILDCFTHMGEMQRMIQFKDKSSEVGENVSVGLFNYPVLMAADILLYGARWVPVGEDQFQHLEITRDIAIRFNNKFGDVFTIPEATAKQTKFIDRDKGLRIRNLVDPSKKMSKSSRDEKSKINLSDNPNVARAKIMGATTDSVGQVNFDWESQPGITNLLQLLSLLTNQSQESVNQEWIGRAQYSQLKSAVAEAVVDFLSSFQNRCNDVSDDLILSTLEKSEAEVSITANQTLLRAQQVVGLRPN